MASYEVLPGSAAVRVLSKASAKQTIRQQIIKKGLF
jgi:hypothetical protein